MDQGRATLRGKTAEPPRTDVRFDGVEYALPSEHFDIDIDERFEDVVQDSPDIPPSAYVDEAIRKDDGEMGTDHTAGDDGKDDFDHDR